MKNHHDLKQMEEDSSNNKEEPSDNIQQDNPVKKFLTRQSKQTRLIILISVIGLLTFTLIATTLPFKDQLFQTLFPKPASLAVDPIDDLTNQLLQVSRKMDWLIPVTLTA